MMTVTQVMSSNVQTVPLSATAEQGIELALKRGVHYLVVVDDYALVGVTCLCDLEQAFPLDYVARCTHAPATFVNCGASLREASEIMLRCNIGCLPVIDEAGILLGIITRHDLRKAGALPNQHGYDLCASCGGSHNLQPPPRPGGVVFCANCLEQSNPRCFEPGYFVVGGG